MDEIVQSYDALSIATAAIEGASNVHNEACKTLTVFPLLPAEIRIQIWEAFFTPRRIILKNWRSRPQPPMRSSATLLLVNREASLVYNQHYELVKKSKRRKGIRINFVIDTLSICIDRLGTMCLQQTHLMERIRYLDVAPTTWGGRPGTRWAMTYLVAMIPIMRSLRLVTVRWGSCTEQYNSSCRRFWPNSICPAGTVAGLLNALLPPERPSPSTHTPVLALLLGPEQASEHLYRILDGSDTELTQRYGNVDMCRGITLREASSSAWDRFDVDVPEVWRSTWVGRDGPWKESGWYAYEIERKSRTDI